MGTVRISVGNDTPGDSVGELVHVSGWGEKGISMAMGRWAGPVVQGLCDCALLVRTGVL